MIKAEYTFGISDKVNKKRVERFCERCWKDNIKMDFRAPDSEDEKWNELFKYLGQWQRGYCIGRRNKISFP